MPYMDPMGCIYIYINTHIYTWSTPPKIISSPLKNDSWKTILSYWVSGVQSIHLPWSQLCMPPSGPAVLRQTRVRWATVTAKTLLVVLCCACCLLLFLFVLVVVDGCGSYHGNPQPSFLGLLSPIFLRFKTYMFHGFLGSCCVVVWSPSCKRGQLRGGFGISSFLICAIGSKLPLFPYNRGWSSTQ